MQKRHKRAEESGARPGGQAPCLPRQVNRRQAGATAGKRPREAETGGWSLEAGLGPEVGYVDGEGARQ